MLSSFPGAFHDLDRTPQPPPPRPGAVMHFAPRDTSYIRIASD
jgi:hypothetical protein